MKKRITGLLALFVLAGALSFRYLNAAFAEAAPQSSAALLGADALAAEMIKNAAEKRVNIVLRALKGELEPSEDCRWRPSYFNHPWKTALYYATNLDEADNPRDFLSALADRGSIMDRWPDEKVEMEPSAVRRRAAIIHALVSNPRILKVVAQAIALAATAPTPERTEEERAPLLKVLAIGRIYLEDYNEAAETQWHAECVQAIRDAVTIDSESAYWGIQYRFNQYGPGEYIIGGSAKPNPDRFIETFFYRRLVLDKISKEDLVGCITAVCEALVSAPK